jgi:hypothetical protein
MALIRANADNIVTSTPRRQAIKSPAHNETKHIWDALVDTTNDYLDNDPRTLQVEVGPSEIGEPCEYCLGAKLAGLRQRKDGSGWLTYWGSVVHDHYDKHVLPTRPHQWNTSSRLYVGDIDGRRIEGTTDAEYIEDPFTVVDLKFVGKKTIDIVKFDAMKWIYECQVNIYGLGHELLGTPPEYVAVAFLPREDRHVRRGYWWSEPYNPEKGRAALARAANLAEQIRLFGWAHVRGHLEQLDGCYDCKRWIQPEEAE